MELLPLAALAILFALLASFAVFIIRAQTNPTEAVEEPAAEPDDPVVVKPAGGARRGAADRMRARLAARQRAGAAQAAAQAEAEAVADAEASGSDGSSDAEDETGDGEGGQGAAGGKKAKKAARKAKREAERAAREARDGKTSVYDERRRRKELQREDRERAQEEEIKRAAAERGAAEEAEAAKWMSMISVAEEGTGEAEAQEDSGGLLNSFIGFIQQRKMVSFEELAVEFKLRSKDVVDRIQGLEAMGRLTGVMDERGKYIYLTQEELEAVASYIRTKGRVAIAELAHRSNQLVDLEPKADVAAVSLGPVVDFDSMFDAELVA